MANFYGAIIGDVAGSYYEVLEIEQKRCYDDRIKVMKKELSLFNNESSLTDDSILTLAIANAILNGKSYEGQLREFGKSERNLGLDKYGRSKFGPGFLKWLDDPNYNQSKGNGCAMRISAGYAFDSLEKTLKEAEKATICSHNTKEAISSARAVAGAIYLARNGGMPEKIRDFAEKELGVKLNFDIEDLRNNYKFSGLAEKSVPQAIYCFLQSNDFEDCLRKSLSIGGDSDTICAISCGIAGAFFDIPDSLVNGVKSYISKDYLKIIDDFNSRYCKQKLNKKSEIVER